MTDNEIQKFFRDQFATEPLRRAFSETFRRIGLDLLDKYTENGADQKGRDLARNIHDALSRTYLFSRGYSDKRTILAIPGIARDLEIIYEQWKTALQYLYDSYDGPASEPTKELFTKDDLLEFIEAADRYIRISKGLRESEVKIGTAINGNLIPYIQKIFLAVYVVMLGDKGSEFVRELERQFAVLMEEHNLAVSKRSGGPSGCFGFMAGPGSA